MTRRGRLSLKSQITSPRAQDYTSIKNNLGRFTPNVSMGMGRFGIGSSAIDNASEDEGDVSDDDGDGDGDMDDDIVELSDEEGDYYDENGRNVSQEDDADDWEDLEF